MLLQSHQSSPVVHPTARVAPTAVISGDVEIGPNCSIGHGAVLVAEGGPIRIGAHCVIMDTAVIRGVPNQVMRLGDHVLVGPRACLVGCTVEDEVFIATGASVFNGAVLGRGSEVRINAVVHLRTVLEADATVPIGWVAVGAPARILPASDHEGIWDVQKTLDFPKYVFNTERPAPGESMMQNVMPRYAQALRRMHADDRALAMSKRPTANAPAGLPEPLAEPAVEDLQLETVLGALADPLRLTIVHRLMHESDAYDHPCGWFGFDRPKSSLTHHFKALREAGVIRQRQYGLERRSRLRQEDLDQRFPGLLSLVDNWQPSMNESRSGKKSLKQA